MTLYNSIVTAVVLSAIPLLAQGQTNLHFTGNPNVDFFGHRLRLDQGLPVYGDSSLPELTSELANGEKSPVVAGLLSLAIPGLGQVYTKNYVKAHAFFTADLMSWLLAYTYNKKGDRQTYAFQNFANQHWSATRYADWTLNNISVLTAGQLARSTYQDVVFIDYDNRPTCPPPFRCIRWDSLNSMEREIGNYGPVGGNGYTHVLPNFGQQQYYELIGKYDEFSRGWDDADLTPLTTSDLPLKNNSPRFVQYQLMRAEANHSYDVAGTWVSVAVINHVLSALDAFWSATRYNKALHAEAHMQMQPTRYGFVPFTELKLSYDF